MTSKNQKQPNPQPKLSPRRRGPRRPRRLAADALSREELEQLWAAYLADRGNLQLRNRLVEHYVPWAAELARMLTSQMAFLDRENAVGEVLAALVESIVPGYDGRGDFERWARVCIRRKLIDLQREVRGADSIFASVPFKHGGSFVPELVHDREQPNYDLKFLELTAELSDLHAAVLWLTHYRGTPVQAVAELLKVSRRTVCSRIREAVASLRDKFDKCPLDERPTHLSM